MFCRVVRCARLNEAPHHQTTRKAVPRIASKLCLTRMRFGSRSAGSTSCALVYFTSGPKMASTRDEKPIAFLLWTSVMNLANVSILI